VGGRTFALAGAGDEAGCELKDTPSRGEADRLHTEPPRVKVRYRGNPPTLGRHWPPGYAVAGTAWNRDPEPGGTGRTLGCPRWSDGVLDALRAFRDEHRGNGPEPIP